MPFGRAQWLFNNSKYYCDTKFCNFIVCCRSAPVDQNKVDYDALHDVAALEGTTGLLVHQGSTQDNNTRGPEFDAAKNGLLQERAKEKKRVLETDAVTKRRSEGPQRKRDDWSPAPKTDESTHWGSAIPDAIQEAGFSGPQSKAMATMWENESQLTEVAGALASKSLAQPKDGQDKYLPMLKAVNQRVRELREAASADVVPNDAVAKSDAGPTIPGHSGDVLLRRRLAAVEGPSVAMDLLPVVLSFLFLLILGWIAYAFRQRSKGSRRATHVQAVTEKSKHTIIQMPVSFNAK